VDERRLTCIPGEGLDLKHFLYDKYLPTNPIVFLLIGRMIYDKGVAEYVDAATIILSKHSNIRFQLLGPSEIDNPSAITKASIDAWVESGVIEYLGETIDVRPFIKSATCVVLPSYREGLPYTLMEASAMGRPVIATNVPGCSQVVDNNVTGVLCKERDVQSLVSAIEQVINLSTKELENMGALGRQKIEKEFDEKYVIHQYLLAINNVIRSDQKHV